MKRRVRCRKHTSKTCCPSPLTPGYSMKPRLRGPLARFRGLRKIRFSQFSRAFSDWAHLLNTCRGHTISRKRYKHWGLRRIRTARDTQLRGKCYKHTRGVFECTGSPNWRRNPCKTRVLEDRVAPSPRGNPQRAQKPLQYPRFWRSCHPHVRRNPCRTRVVGDRAIPSPRGNPQHALISVQYSRFCGGGNYTFFGWWELSLLSSQRWADQ